MASSSAHNDVPQNRPATASQVNFWDDDTVNLNNQRIKQTVPALPKISMNLQVIRGGGAETLAYLALQIVKSTDKVVLIRAIASACSCLLEDSRNFTGSPMKSVELTGLEPAEAEGADREKLLVTNFEDASPVTIGELLDLMQADADELGAFFGVMFLAGNKKINAQNRSAFNEKRAQSATASIIGDPMIFVVDSPYLADEVCANMYAAFLSMSPVKSNMTAMCVELLNKVHMGPSLSFMTMFLLLQDQGMSALRIIKEAVLKHPWIRSEFTGLAPELSAANKAQQIIRSAPGTQRSFLKAIHGNAFVPVNYSEIENLTGICKEILKRTTPSYQNYSGGKITDAQLAIINSHADVAPAITATVAAE